ncbi:MAG: magnesium/cobalt transporter CorA [Candidatus Latescibacterota bacterium]|nr:MAG: magnesium/cobalt transporter CorA [Candidatus Latescibacterota bacterium]
MPRFLRPVRRKIGASPGTLEHVGEKKVERVRIRVIDYSPESLEEKELSSAEECSSYRDTRTVSWINIDGLHDTNVLAKIGEQYGLHPLVMEDVMNTNQRPKVEDYQDYLFVIMRMLFYDPEKKHVTSEQVSFILGRHYVLSFQERYGDVFEPVRERIRSTGRRIRKQGPDYLLYALIDAVVDNYFVILENFGEQIESLESDLIDRATPESLQMIHELKRETIFLRKSIWPLREAVSALERGESSLIKKGTRVFLRDVYDHTVQVIDVVESFRDMVSGMQDLYLSSMSNRMNEVMKVLTIIATIFVPLTFVAGIYGMNFDFMPELRWKWSYVFFWLVIAAICGAMLTYFKRKRWL